MIATRRDRITLATGILLALTAACRAQQSTSDTLAGQIKATEVQNQQLDAAMAGMKRERPAPRRAAVSKAAAIAKRRPAAAPVASRPVQASDTATGKQFQVGPVTITPGGFVAVDSFSR